MCICIYFYMCIYTCKYIYVCKQINMYMCMYIWGHVLFRYMKIKGPTLSLPTSFLSDRVLSEPRTRLTANECKWRLTTHQSTRVNRQQMLLPDSKSPI